MTTASITDRVRRLVQDTEEPYHWTDEQIKADIKSAICALHKVRPDTRYVKGLLVDSVLLPDDDSANIDIEERFADALAYYAAHMAYSDDCTDPVSKQLADDFLAKFNAFAQT